MLAGRFVTDVLMHGDDLPIGFFRTFFFTFFCMFNLYLPEIFVLLMFSLYKCELYFYLPGLVLVLDEVGLAVAKRMCEKYDFQWYRWKNFD